MIYRDYSCSLTTNNCKDILQKVALSKATIVSTFVLSNAFPENNVNRWSMFFRLKFKNQEDLDKFHSLGLQTTEPEVIRG